MSNKVFVSIYIIRPGSVQVLILAHTRRLVQRVTHRGSARHTKDAASEAVWGLSVTLDKQQLKSAVGLTAAVMILVLIL